MAGLKHTITFITVICWGSVVSINTNWSKAMDICIIGDQQPSSEDNATKNGSWVGKVKYSFPWGYGILQIQTVNKNNTCSDCDALGKQCEFCNNRIQLNGSVAAFEVLKNLKSGRHYILAEFGKQSLSGLPPPTQCMVHRGASHTEYVSCNEKYDDGCHESGENSGTYITICFDMYCNGTTQADMDFVEYNSQEINGAGNDCSLSSYFGCMKHLPIVGGGLLVLVLFDVMCIYCCVRHIVKRKTLAIQKEKTREHTSRPISEAITRIYKHMNNFEDQHNSSYDLVVNMSRKAHFNALDETDTSEDYDKGFFRLASHSGDYDKAWCNNWSSTPSPDADYAKVQAISNQIMTTVPEEEIYSKQRLDPESIYADINRSGSEKEEEVTPNMRSTGSSTHIRVVNESVKIGGNGGMNQRDKQTCAEGNSETITLEKKESKNDKHDISERKTQGERLINDKFAEVCLKRGRDPLVIVAGNKDINSNQSNNKNMKVRRSKLKRGSKAGNISSGDVACNFPAKRGENENTNDVSISTTEAGKMVDEETAILIENLNNISSKTKL